MKIKTEIKQCSKCKQPLSVAEFYKNPMSLDGLRSQCKECQKEYRTTEQSRKYQEEYCKEYAGTEHGKTVLYEANEKFRKTLKGHLQVMFNAMNQRCNNPKNKYFKWYGGRGIQNLFKDLKEFRDYIINELGVTAIGQIKGLQIDRVDNDGDYERGNIRFVTAKVNNNNQRRNNARVIIKEE